jgi:hypothetical protein
MTTDSTITTYTIDINGVSGQAIGTFTDITDFWTDEFALQFGTALGTLTWPEGGNFQIIKMVDDQTRSSADFTQDPPVFD